MLFVLIDQLLDRTPNLLVVTPSVPASDLKSFSAGSYDSTTGTWTGSATQFNSLSFHAGEDGTQNLTITASTSEDGPAIRQTVEELTAAKAKVYLIDVARSTFFELPF